MCPFQVDKYLFNVKNKDLEQHRWTLLLWFYWWFWTGIFQSSRDVQPTTTMFKEVSKTLINCVKSFDATNWYTQTVLYAYTNFGQISSGVPVLIQWTLSISKRNVFSSFKQMDWFLYYRDLRHELMELFCENSYRL